MLKNDPESNVPKQVGIRSNPTYKGMIYGMDILASVLAIKDPESLIVIRFLCPLPLLPGNNMQLG